MMELVTLVQHGAVVVVVVVVGVESPLQVASMMGR